MNAIFSKNKPIRKNWLLLRIAIALSLIGVVALGFALWFQTREHDVTETFLIPNSKVDLVIIHPKDWLIKQGSYTSSNTKYWTWNFRHKTSAYPFLQRILARFLPSRQPSFQGFNM